ncbi:Cytochrome b, partial [Melipona quadrifasciata]
FSINNLIIALNRFLSFHFILPLIIIINTHKITFHQYFVIKDLVTIVSILLIFIFINLQNPYLLRDPDNFKIAHSLIQFYDLPLIN